MDQWKISCVERIMTEIAEIRPRTYPYLIDDCSDGEKAKGTKKCVTLTSKQGLKQKCIMHLLIYYVFI